MTRVTVGTLLREGCLVLARQWPWLLAGGVAMALVQAVQLALRGQGAGAALGIKLVELIAQYGVHALVTRRIMLGEQLASVTVPARYGHYVLAALAVGVGAVAGAMVLVVPGIMLLLRWSLAPCFTLSRGMSARDALGASRDATRGHRWALLGAWAVWGLLVLVPYGALIAAAGGLHIMLVMPLMSPVGLGRLAWVAAATCGSLAFAVGSFSVLAGRQDRLGEIFS